jgi:hypothetical protein
MWWLGSADSHCWCTTSGGAPSSCCGPSGGGSGLSPRITGPKSTSTPGLSARWVLRPSSRRRPKPGSGHLREHDRRDPAVPAGGRRPSARSGGGGHWRCALGLAPMSWTPTLGGGSQPRLVGRRAPGAGPSGVTPTASNVHSYDCSPSPSGDGRLSGARQPHLAAS